MRLASDRFELRPGDALYPEQLLDLPHPPDPLYGRGDPSALGAPSIAVVGSRRPTPYGLAVAEMAATAAVQAGITVVSGGAVGCDQAAGHAALDAGGTHIIVLGCGADEVYPKTSAGLIDRAIRAGGAVVSLERWGTGPRPYAFPKRNVVIAGLARATCVTEAGMPSGTFSTAEAANRLGREVLAVPGSILSPESRGSNYLLSIGATALVDEESIEVAISRIFGTLRRERQVPGVCATGEETTTDRIVGALVASPLRADEIASLIGANAVDCLTYLSSLQMSGTIERMLDGRYSLTKRALRARSAIIDDA